MKHCERAEDDTTKASSQTDTFFEFRIPVVSWIAFRLTFMYAGPGSEWFKFNM